MGLCSNLNDVSSDSIPLLLLAILANFICYIRTFFFGLFESMGLSSRFDSILLNDHQVLGSEEIFESSNGLSSLVLLTDQLKMNPVFAFKQDEEEEEEEDRDGLQCVVCLCRLRDGAHVRKLACRHIFHKECLDGWLFDHCNLTCPLCRSPLITSNHDKVITSIDHQTSLFGNFIPWFSMT